MVELLNKAFEAVKTLPPEDRERLAWEIIDRVDSKNKWDRLVASPEARKWLASAAAQAVKAHRKTAKPLSMGLVNMEHDNLLRESAYWSGYDTLPEDIRKLAESNYRLWKKSPTHPSLRFKRIHDEQPIFSFRIGAEHRTVGVEADGDRIVWFWVGSFDNFRAVTGMTAS
ncbi:MAG: hypothetical protein OQK07_09165 [Rhodospirillales bacterium]|nr:hypothetical protein [Rhodospirillales bacterium]